MGKKQQYQQCYVIGRDYRVRSHQLFEDDPYWRDLNKGRVYYEENVHLNEQEALRDALHRARLRRDELNDLIDGLQSRLTATEDREIHEEIRQAG